ncbi:hypothetical protein [Streptosporangium sandarakinum]|uniref:hypothetical protein n=1 Tax=Streptosporangium sandarakinum TaxID=1260955 RepID=UPI0033BFA6C6
MSTSATEHLTDTAPADEDAAVAALLADLDITVVETGPATTARKCSTDNGCDTLANGDC